MPQQPASAGDPKLYESRPPNHPQGAQSGRLPIPEPDGSSNEYDPIWTNIFESEMFCQKPLRHHRLGPQHYEYSGLRINVTNVGGIYSWHAGANTLFCDGHVKFYTEQTDPELLLKLISRSDGELIDPQCVSSAVSPFLVDAVSDLTVLNGRHRSPAHPGLGSRPAVEP